MPRKKQEPPAVIASDWAENHRLRSCPAFARAIYVEFRVWMIRNRVGTFVGTAKTVGEMIRVDAGAVRQGLAFLHAACVIDFVEAGDNLTVTIGDLNHIFTVAKKRAESARAATASRLRSRESVREGYTTEYAKQETEVKAKCHDNNELSRVTEKSGTQSGTQKVRKPDQPRTLFDDLPNGMAKAAEKFEPEKPQHRSENSGGPAADAGERVMGVLIAQEWNFLEGVIRCRGVTPSIMKAVGARSREPFFAANWRNAIDALRESGAAQGKKITWFLAKKTVLRILGQEQSFDPLNFPIPESLRTAEFQQSWAAWCKHRSRQRNPLTAESCEIQMRDMEQAGVTASIEAIRTSISANYKGVFPKKVEANGNAKSNLTRIKGARPLSEIFASRESKPAI